MQYWTLADYRAAWPRPEHRVAMADFLRDFTEAGQSLRALRYVARDSWQQQIEALAGRTSGALLGVPLAHKELFHRAGWPAEGGSCSRGGTLATETAFSILRLDAAGALDAGRLSSVEFALGTTGHHAMMGTPINPWHGDYIPGGSSSGSAVMVAAGAIPVSLGTDTGGSIRLPAAACGLFGLKPTFGALGRGGVFPLSNSLDTIGPMARNVDDLEAVFQAICGWDAFDQASVDYQYQRADIPSTDLRLGVAEDYFFAGSEASVNDAILDIVERLECASIQDVVLDDIQQANDWVMLITAVEAAALHGAALPDILPQINDETALRIATGLYVDQQAYLQACAMRAGMVQKLLDGTLRDIDVLITPLWPYCLPTLAETDGAQNPRAHEIIRKTGHNTRPFNFLGFPAMTVPIARDHNGLPISMQIVGKPFCENKLFVLARQIEWLTGFWQTRPKNAF